MESFGLFLEKNYLIFIGITAFLFLALIGYFVDKKTRKGADIAPLFSKVGKKEKVPKAPKEPKAKKAKREKGDPIKQPIMPQGAMPSQSAPMMNQSMQQPVQSAPMSRPFPSAQPPMPGPAPDDNQPMNLNMGESGSIDSL